MSSIALSSNNTTASTAMPDDNTIYVVAAFTQPKNERIPGQGPGLCLLAGGTDAARSKLDHPPGRSARTSIRDLMEWSRVSSRNIMSDYKNLTDDDLKSKVVKDAFKQWERDTTSQLSEMLQSFMARTKPEGFVVEMDDEKTEGLEEATKALGMSAGARALKTEMVDRDTWDRWMGCGTEFNHLLLYNFDKTDLEADCDAYLTAQVGTENRGY